MAASASTMRPRRRRNSGTHSLDLEGASGVRVVEADKGNRSVVELSSTKANNPLYRAFRALRALGVSIVHAEVRAASDRMVQRLYLMESDGRSLEPSRLTEVLVALDRARPLGLSDRLQGAGSLVA
jgi:hypothetical protein